jgi:rubredoxin
MTNRRAPGRSAVERRRIEAGRAFEMLPDPLRSLALNLVEAATLMEYRCDACGAPLPPGVAMVACVELGDPRTSVTARWLCRECSYADVGPGEHVGPIPLPRVH